MQPGDVLLSFDGLPIIGVDDLHRTLTAERAGIPVSLCLLRRTEILTVQITPLEN